MKIKAAILVVLMSVILIGMSLDGVLAAEDEKGSLKVGVVSVRRILLECTRATTYREQVMVEGQKLEQELQQLSQEVDRDKAGLSAFKSGSSDYMALLKQVFEKQGKLQAQQEFFKQQMSMLEQGIIEQLFKDIIVMTETVAKEKGFDLVFEKSEPELPAANSNELTLTISTHKLLYSGNSEDITSEVLARLNSAQ